MTRSIVDFPAPFGPTTAVVRPAPNRCSMRNGGTACSMTDVEGVGTHNAPASPRRRRLCTPTTTTSEMTTRMSDNGTAACGSSTAAT